MSRVANAIEELVRAITDEAVGVAVCRALSERERRNEQVLSANQASRLAKCRRIVLTEALENGGLQGRKQGRRWSVLVEDVKSWVKNGKPKEDIK